MAPHRAVRDEEGLIQKAPTVFRLALEVPVVSGIASLKTTTCTLQNKAYPREALLRGRVRVALRGPDGKPLNPAVTSRSKLLREIAALLPRHPARVNRPKQPAGGAAAAAAAAAAAVGSSASGSKQQVSAKKGGGKKKR